MKETETLDGGQLREQNDDIDEQRLFSKLQMRKSKKSARHEAVVSDTPAHAGILLQSDTPWGSFVFRELSYWKVRIFCKQGHRSLRRTESDKPEPVPSPFAFACDGYFSEKHKNVTVVLEAFVGPRHKRWQGTKSVVSLCLLKG